MKISEQWCEHLEGKEAFRCLLCPRHCILKQGQRGFCFVRQANSTGINLTSYGKNCGLQIDPIEKKPLYHFLPGSKTLSFGTAGCNLGCKFCQNWHLSRSKDVDNNSYDAEPGEIAAIALQENCKSVAFTYNDPVVFAEYAIDTAKACHERGIKTVAVTAGYMEPTARTQFYKHIDAANIDLKGFSNDFYRKFCSAELAPVLDTLKYVAHETNVWLEVTTLLIPGLNDGEDEIDRMTKWFASNLGCDVPLHFSAFFPHLELSHIAPTPKATLLRSKEIAQQNGLTHIYLGNVAEADLANTICPSCKAILIRRSGYSLNTPGMSNGSCNSCGFSIRGKWI